MLLSLADPSVELLCYHVSPLPRYDKQRYTSLQCYIHYNRYKKTTVTSVTSVTIVTTVTTAEAVSTLPPSHSLQRYNRYTRHKRYSHCNATSLQRYKYKRHPGLIISYSMLRAAGFSLALSCTLVTDYPSTPNLCLTCWCPLLRACTGATEWDSRGGA